VILPDRPDREFSTNTGAQTHPFALSPENTQSSAGAVAGERRPPPPSDARAAKRAYLSFGSNLGNRVGNIRSALEMLAGSGVEVRRVSSLYKTEPVDFRAQAWFVNCVAEVETELMPLQLLKALQAVERKLGRRRGTAKGPRQIDIDILLYEKAVIRSAALTVPHERLAQRRFVLVPLRELAAGARHPVTRRTVLEMLSDTPDTSHVRKLRTGSLAEDERLKDES
jgi:2-amino-4-hydroxy-6-hydroxymethyldihydropteridine diphosphokinase